VVWESHPIGTGELPRFARFLLGRKEAARAAYREALAQVTLPAERRFLETRLARI
jgi:predicted RNA polymerase sigma factor